MKQPPILPVKASRTSFRFTPSRFLIAAALLHLAVTIAVFAAGRYALMPGTFDANGIVVPIASDARRHRADAATLAELLQRREFQVWFSSAYPFHVKFFSIPFAVLGPLVGFN